MNKVTTINNSKDMALQSRMLAEGTEAIAKFGTIDECVYSYNNAETIVDSFYERERTASISYIRAKALLSLKRLTLGDFWNSHISSVPNDLVDKWYGVLDRVELGDSKKYVRDLLRFANYNESTALAGVKVVSPYEFHISKLSGAMKKYQSKPATSIEIAKVYDSLARKQNDSKPFSSVPKMLEAYEKEMSNYIEPKVEKREVVVEATEEEEKHVEVLINIRKVFENEVGKCPEPNNSQVTSRTMLSFFDYDLPREEWKAWYRKASMLFHPDHGGTTEEFAILKSFDNMYQENFNAWDRINAYKTWNEDFNQWKIDNGYDADEDHVGYMEESLVKEEHLNVEDKED